MKSTISLFLIALTLSSLGANTHKTNVIYILADDLGWGEVGYNGQKMIETPELDSLAAHGMRFTAHYSGNSVCAPARCSLMTGKHAGNAYIRSNSPGFPNGQTPIPLESETVAKLFKRAGYHTALIGKWGLGGYLPRNIQSTGYPNKQGFDYFFGYLDQRHAHNYYTDHLFRNADKVPLGSKTYSHDLKTEEALKYIREQKNGPFFLYLAYNIPHTKYQVPSLGQYADKEWPEEMKIHAAMTSRLDRDIGTIKNLLHELNIAENTLLIFNSDNGAHGEKKSEEFFNTSGSLRDIKRSMYEGGLRTPMIAYWPETIEPGSSSDHISAFWDMLPTFSELTGEPIKGKTDGISMLPTLVGEPDKQEKHKYLYWELYERKPNAAIRMGKWKAVIPDRRQPDEIELYDLSQDESEKNNLAAQNPELIAKLKAYMDKAHTPTPLWQVESQGRRFFRAEVAKKINGI